MMRPIKPTIAALCLGLWGVVACAPRERPLPEEQKAGEPVKAEPEQASTDLKAGADRAALLHDQVRVQLGAGWRVERAVEGREIVATRNTPSLADEDALKKVDAQASLLAQEHKDLAATFNRGTLVLQGRMEDCANAPSIAAVFAKIGGVNEIRLGLTCMK